MRRILYFRVAGRDVHIPKLIGSFIVLAAFLMFVQASATMFNSWDNAKEADRCLQFAAADAARETVDEKSVYGYKECQQLAKDFLGVRVREGQDGLSLRQFWGSLLGPIASILFWLSVLFVGYILYKSGELVLPIEETIREVPDAPKRPFKKKK